MLKKFWKNEDGDTNFVSLIIIIIIVAVAILLLKPYVAKIVSRICLMCM